jgi:hypothetical protein
MSARVRKRTVARGSAVAFNGYQVAAALYVATGGLIDLASPCMACKAHGLFAGCPLCKGTGKIPS